MRPSLLIGMALTRIQARLRPGTDTPMTTLRTGWPVRSATIAGFSSPG